MGAAAARTPGLDPRLVEEVTTRRRERAHGPDLWSGLALAVGFLAVATPLALLLPEGRNASPLVVVSLVVALALAANVRFTVGSGWVVPTQLVLVPMFFVLPVGWVPLAVAGAHVLAVVIARPAHVSRALYMALANSWHSIGPALVLGLALDPPRFPDLGAWPVYLGALGAQFAIDYLRSIVRPWLVLGVSPLKHLRSIGQAYMVDAALAPVGFAVGFVAYVNPAGVVLVVPLMGLLAYFSQDRQARIDHALELGRAYRGTALLLGDVVEADDSYTGEHSRDVVSLVLSVADVLDLDSQQRQEAEFVALLHDVGKIRIPNDIINKPGPLTAHERAVVEQHTVVGQEMLAKVGGMLGEVGRLVRSCHERWDGTGYPDQLSGARIPLVSRIVCACDAYSAMTTDRPYRQARPAAEALAELRRCSGTQFDPVVVEAVAAIVAEDDVRPAAA